MDQSFSTLSKRINGWQGLLVVFLIIISRIILGEYVLSDGLGQVWFGERNNVKGISFTAWAGQTNVLADDMVIAINGVPITQWLDQLYQNPIAIDSIRKPTSIAFKESVTYEILDINQRRREVTLRMQPLLNQLWLFDWRYRWSIPSMILSFLLVGGWLYLQRPHEPSAKVLFQLSCAIAIYQIFQPTLRQISDISQPFVFWYSLVIATLAGLIIVASLNHLALIYPFRATFITTKYGWWFIRAVYITPTLLLGVFILGRLLTQPSTFDRLRGLQQDWQLIQTISYVTCLIFMIWHYRSSQSAHEKQILRATVLGTIPILLFILFSEKVFLLLDQKSPIDDNIRRISSALFPVLLAVGIWRNHVFRIEKIVSKTITHAIILSILIIIELSLFAVLGQIFDDYGVFISFMFSGLLFMLIFQPLRENIYIAIDRWIYGKRLSLNELMLHLEDNIHADSLPDQALQMIAKNLVTVLNLTSAQIYAHKPIPLHSLEAIPVKHMVAQAGENSKNETVQVPLICQNKSLGELHLTFSTQDLPIFPTSKMFMDLLGQKLGTMLYALQITSDLNQAQIRINMHEQEQRRMRQDLHDGLGAGLGGLILVTDAVKQNVESGILSTAFDLLNTIKQALRNMHDDVRNIARMDDSLRPMELTQLGLIGAIQAYLNIYTQQLSVNISFQGDFHKLPAKVDSAAYLIVREAINNVVKHAQASRCNLQLIHQATPKPALIIKVMDDGCGFPHFKDHTTLSINMPGIGIRSMQKRCDDLGGTFVMLPNQPKGTIIDVVIPIN